MKNILVPVGSCKNAKRHLQYAVDFAKEFNAKLFTARKISEHTIVNSKLSDRNKFYFPSLSATTIIYKGLLMPEDIRNYYIDLSNPDLVTRLALVHQRFSTNTFPSWDLAQPFKYMCHNGEINTLRGNVNRMKARQELMESDIFGDDLKKLFPIILEGKDLLSGFHSSSHLRCCYCHQTLSLGNKTPIKLSCGHVICFKCHMQAIATPVKINRKIRKPTSPFMVSPLLITSSIGSHWCR